MRDFSGLKTQMEARLTELDARIHKIEDQLDDPVTKDWEDGAQEREGDEVLEGMGLAGLREMELIRAARGDGADLITLPEMVTMLEPQDALVLEKALPEDRDPGLAAFRAQQQGLQLVFLNGCATQPQTDGLLDANVSMVISTSRAIDDQVATDFSCQFY